MKTSIIMTSYNYEKFIPQAIESVINQTVSEWELIIVDDGSKDNSLNIIKQYCQKDSRIKLLTHPNNRNKGLKVSLLLGINAAQNEWLAFLESDDYWAPNYLEEKIKMIGKYPECAFIYNNVECFGDEKKVKMLEPYFKKLLKIWGNREIKDIFDEFVVKNIVPTFSCVMCKKTELLKCNTNPPAQPVLDYWLWWQLAENSQFCFIDKKLTFWRIHSSSYLSKSQKTFSHHIKRAQFVRQISKILKRKPKLYAKYITTKTSVFSLAMYILIYIKKKAYRSIQKLLKTC